MGWTRRLLGDIRCSQVLDVATGTGRFIEDLRILKAMTGNRHVQIIGVDRLRGAVASAPNRGGDTHFLAMDATRLGFSDSSFDLVCLVRSLHHMPDTTQARALAEMHRVLKPGGRFFVAEMYRDGQTETQMTDVLLHHWIAAVETATAGIPPRWVHRETFTRAEIIRIMQNVPLRELQFHDVAFLDEDHDPHEEWLIGSEEKNLDRYISRFLNGPKPVSGNDALRDRAEALRHRLHTVGINSATLLVAVGMK